MKDRIGQKLGNYQLMRILGEGSFAEVYLGEHVYLKRQAAIKVLRGRLVNDEMEGFLTEARTSASLEHPHIVRVLDFGIEDGTPFLIMSYAPNGTLRQRYPESIPLPPTIILPYMKQIAAALQYAHDQKLIHRDIKPHNMLLGPNNEVWLSDFGVVQMARSTLTQTVQNMAGSPSYMAPEQFQGKPRIASDQYALGVVVYEWLCGDRPFHGSFTELYSQHMFMPPPPPHEKIPAISPAVEEVLLRALAKDPHQRFPSVQAFVDALEWACQLAPYLLSASNFDLPPAPWEGPSPTLLAPEESAPFAQTLLASESINSSVPSASAPVASLQTAQDSSAPGSLNSSASTLGPHTSAKPLPPPPHAPSVLSAPAPSQSETWLNRKLSRLTILAGLVGSAIVAGGGAVAWKYVFHRPSIARGPAAPPPPLGTTLYTYTGHTNAVKAIVWSPSDGKRIVSASLDRTVQVWDATTGGHVLKYTGHTNQVKTVAWSPDGKLIASGGLDGTVQVWDAATGGKAFFLLYSGHKDVVEAVAWSPDGTRLASGSGSANIDNTVQIWDAANGHPFFTYNTHSSVVWTVAWSPDGMYIASGSGSGGPQYIDNTVRVWQAL